MNQTIISQYTSNQATEDGYLMPLTPKILMTVGVYNLKGQGFTEGKNADYLFEEKLVDAIEDGYNKQPTINITDGSDDRDFFTITWRGTKFFVARNETGGLTIMLPDEY